MQSEKEWFLKMDGGEDYFCIDSKTDRSMSYCPFQTLQYGKEGF